MEKLDVLTVIIVCETKTDIVDKQLLFQDTLKITSAIGVPSSELFDESISIKDKSVLIYIPLQKDIQGNSIDNSIRFITDDKINREDTVTEVERTYISPRNATEKELKLLNEFIKNEVGKNSSLPDQQNFNFRPFELLVFDISPTHKIIFECSCSIIRHSDNQRVVTSYPQKYTIKHDIVYKCNEDEYFDAIDEDISEITDLL